MPSFSLVFTVPPFFHRVNGTEGILLARYRFYAPPEPFIVLQACSKRERAPSANRRHETRPPIRCCVKRTEKISALHVDGHRFSKLKLERRLRPQLDVLPACHQCNRRSGARSHGTADQRARAAAGQGA